LKNQEQEQSSRAAASVAVGENKAQVIADFFKNLY
jgi:hypothetical protein